MIERLPRKTRSYDVLAKTEATQLGAIEVVRMFIPVQPAVDLREAAEPPNRSMPP
jgi:hypothetical protein